MSKLRWGLATGLALACAAAAGIPTLAQSSRTTSHQMTPRAFKMNSPLSGSVLLARGLRSGVIRPIGAARVAGSRSKLPASALPNVQASGGNGSSVANETPIVVNPINPQSMISGANDYNCASFQGFYFSHDGGATWTATCFPLEPAAIGGDGDPVVGYLTGAKTEVFAGGIDEDASQNGEIVIASYNHKKDRWNTPVVAADVPGIFMDKPWLEIDNGSGSPFKKTLYVSMTQFDSNNGSKIGVSHSTDGGQTWTLVDVDKARTYPDVDQFSDLAIDSSGNVYVSWMRCTATGPTFDCGGTIATMMVSKSTDGGTTWSKPVATNTVALAADSCFCTFYGTLPNTLERVSDIPVIAADTSNTSSNGRLYITDANYDRKFHVLRVQVVTSTDGGATWSKPVNVSSNKDKAVNDQFFPWINVSDGGLVGVTWMDRRNDSSNVNYQEFGTTSSDGAGTFALNTQLADVPSDPWNDGFGGFFIGDYTGNAWTPGSTLNLMASWTDTRTGEDQDEVGGLTP
jgi:BNR/Asp-box repeat